MKGYQVTLTTHDTNYNLLVLVHAIDSTFVDRGEFVIQCEDDGGAQLFLLGGSDLDATHYGVKMAAGDFSAHFPALAGINARCDTDGKKLNVQVIR
jgi:hypothetical protein